MQIIQNDKHTHIVEVRFNLDEYKAIVRESTKTQLTILEVIQNVLESGFHIVNGTLYCKVKDRQ